MKSGTTALEKRGWIDEHTKNPFSGYAAEALLDICVRSKAPRERSLAVRGLGVLTPEMAGLLLECLAIEKALYTKIYICEKLQTGEAEIAKIMLPYLGKIGNNQYQVLPDVPSKKKSYPLPRDIIARTLAKMDEHIIYTLVDALAGLGSFEAQLSELIDSIGWMSFYATAINKEDVYATIVETMRGHQDNKLITWKFLTCLSAFPQGLAILEDYCEHATLPILAQEAVRSRELLLSRAHDNITK